MVTDPIADILIQIKNGYMARMQAVTLPYSTMKEQVLSVLAAEGYVKSFEVATDKKHPAKKSFTITLSYPKGQPAVTQVKRVSKPGVRIYAGRYRIPRVMTGYGMAIVSTSKGIMTDTQARKLGVGGEILCTIW